LTIAEKLAFCRSGFCGRQFDKAGQMVHLIMDVTAT